MQDGWWRLPFLVTIPLGLTALWIRTRLGEAPVFSGGRAAGPAAVRRTKALC
jgi:hypothetical protein